MKTIIKKLFLSLIFLACAGQWKAFAAFPIATDPSSIQISCGTAFDGTNSLALIISDDTLVAQLFATNGTLIGPQINIGNFTGFPPDAAVVFAQGKYLVAWADTSIYSAVDMFGQFISPGGALIGSPFNLLASQGSYGFQELRALATDGTNFLAVWQDDNNGSFNGQFIGPSGALSGPPFSISSMLGSGSFAAAVFGKTNYLVVWMSNNAVTDGENQTYGAVISPDPTVSSPTKLSAIVSTDQSPLAAAFDGNNYYVVWPADYSAGYGMPNWELDGRFVSQSGAPIGNIYSMDPAHPGGDMLFPSLAFNNGNYLLSWSELYFNPNQSLNPTNSNLYFHYFDTAGSWMGPTFTQYSADGANTPLLSINGLTPAGSGFASTATLGMANFSDGYLGSFYTGEVWGTYIPPAGGSAAFTATPTNGTVPLTIQFNSPSMDSLGNNILKWNWNFGDGYSSILQNPSHTYTNPGNYSPSLLGQNNKGNFVLGFGPSITAWSATPVFSSFYSFNGSDANNANGFPAVSGNATYDTAPYGGLSFSGNIFKIGLDYNFNDLHDFGGSPDGANPYSAPIISGNTLYGASYQGGVNGTGFIYKVNTDGTGYSNVYSFSAPATNNFTNSDGAYPYGGLTLGGNTLYGTASFAGAYGYGTVWKVNTDGTGFSTLYHFRGLDDGAGPRSRMALDGTNLYGATPYTVYSVNTSTLNFSLVYKFSDTQGPRQTNNDGFQVVSPIFLCGCTLYGTASQGGFYGNGTVFRVNTDGTAFSVLHHFSSLNVNGYNSDGSETQTNGVYAGGCVSAVWGRTLFGTASYGGAYGSGTIFSLKIDGSIFQTLYNFSARDTNYVNPDGAQPNGMTLYNRTFYGTTASGGLNSYGTLFSYFPAVQSAPRLHIAAFGNNVVLSWPTRYNGYSLLYSTSLGPSANWLPVPYTPSVVNNRNTVTNPISGQEMYFQLVF